MRIAVTGSSGLIGTPLVAALRADGHDVVRLVRGAPAGPEERAWDPASGHLEPAVLEDRDAVVHLAGAGVGDKRWSDAYKQLVLDSRVRGTTAVAEAVAQVGPGSDGPRVLLSGSAIGYYGDTGDRVTDESGPLGQGFLADVTRQWEAATAPAQQAGAPVVHAFPLLPLAPGVPLAVGSLGWNGTFCVGISADPALVPEAEAFGRALRAVVDELAAGEPAPVKPGDHQTDPAADTAEDALVRAEEIADRITGE